MRYPATEKLEIIRTVEGSHLPVKQTLDMLGIPRTTFYRWYDRYVEGGFDALTDRAGRKASRRYVVAKVSLTACITIGRRNSLRLESVVSPATRRVRRHPRR